MLLALAPRAARARRAWRPASSASRGPSSPRSRRSPAPPSWSGRARDDGCARRAARRCRGSRCPALAARRRRARRASRREAGADGLFTENLWPVDFLRVAGFGSQTHWAPFDLASVAVDARARGASTRRCSPALVAAARALRARAAGSRRARSRCGRSPRRRRLAARLSAPGARWASSPTARGAVEDECRHLLIGMSWLPALGFAAAACVAVRFLRGGARRCLGLVGLRPRAGRRRRGARRCAPTTPSPPRPPTRPTTRRRWCCCSASSTSASAERWPGGAPGRARARSAPSPLGLAAYALVGLYPDQNTPVHTARGTFVTDAAAAPGAAADDRLVDATHRARRADPRRCPSDAGLYFMTGRRPALYDVMFLPGPARLARRRARRPSRACERERVAPRRRRRRRFSATARHVRRRLQRLLGGALRGATVSSETVGRLSDPAAGTNPSERLHGRPPALVSARRPRWALAGLVALAVAVVGCGGHHQRRAPAPGGGAARRRRPAPLRRRPQREAGALVRHAAVHDRPRRRPGLAGHRRGRRAGQLPAARHRPRRRADGSRSAARAPAPFACRASS